MKNLISIICLSVLATNSIAQVWHKNKFPSPESATYDNNGNDLRGFINTYKNDFLAKGTQVKDASGNDWGYLQVKNVKTPGSDKEGNLNYYEAFDVTLMMFKTRDGGKASWWAREHNSPKGSMKWFKAGEPGTLTLDNVKYTEIISELQTKIFTIVEYADSMYSQNDFEILLKNTVFLKNGTIKELGDYKAMINFYNKFLDKFTNVNDAVLDNKSFITFFKGATTQYAGYFNIVNGKLSGKVEAIDAPFERDREKFINDMFKKLNGSAVYLYGDDTFGMENIIKKRAMKQNLKLNRRNTSSTKKFNADI